MVQKSKKWKISTHSKGTKRDTSLIFPPNQARNMGGVLIISFQDLMPHEGIFPCSLKSRQLDLQMPYALQMNKGSGKLTSQALLSILHLTKFQSIVFLLSQSPLFSFLFVCLPYLTRRSTCRGSWHCRAPMQDEVKHQTEN